MWRQTTAPLALLAWQTAVEITPNASNTTTWNTVTSAVIRPSAKDPPNVSIMGLVKKCYQGYGQACSPGKSCFYGAMADGIAGPPEGDVGSICIPGLQVCNPSPCVPGLGLCGVYSCNPTGSIEISYEDDEVELPGDEALWSTWRTALSQIWDEGEIFDPSVPFTQILPPKLLWLAPLLTEFAQAHACINPGSLSQGKVCIGTNHCEEGLTCKGFPFWSICVP
jgi:hypothetical protein